MKRHTWTTIAAVTLALAMSAPAEAQRRRDSDDEHRRTERVRDRDGDRRDDARKDDRRVRGEVSERNARTSSRNDRSARRQERGNGPSFCRSGRGHPVFGWDWCRERGWDRSGSRAIRWEQRGWEDVVFRIPGGDGRRTLDRRGLGEVLGDIVFGRIDTTRRLLGPSDDYAGRWTTHGSTRVLWITAAGVPIARLVDTDGDRRVDAVFTAER